MKPFAMVTSLTDLPNDDDMPILVSACRSLGLPVEVCAWDDPQVNWSRYTFIVLRSTWDYTERRDEFLKWCEDVAGLTRLNNPLAVAKWATDKHYLADLAALGVPVVPTLFVEPGMNPPDRLEDFLKEYPSAVAFVVKPSVGSYSKNVKRYDRRQASQAAGHVASLLERGCSAMLQPYLASVDRDGETNLIYFDRTYSHAIRKSALLLPDGTVNGPSPEFRNAREAGDDERAAALTVLDATATHLGLERPLLYGRVDLIRDDEGIPRLLELDICEPSLSLRFHEAGALRFAHVLAEQLG